jgi:hypothetical protein
MWVVAIIRVGRCQHVLLGVLCLPLVFHHTSLMSNVKRTQNIQPGNNNAGKRFKSSFRKRSVTTL